MSLTEVIEQVMREESYADVLKGACSVCLINTGGHWTELSSTLSVLMVKWIYESPCLEVFQNLG